MKPASEKHVTIHGYQWKWADLIEAIEFCRTLVWKRATWKPRDALVHKRGGATSLYLGQHFDPAKIDLVNGGWNHDHCEICWWTLCETENTEEGVGYTDGRCWLCKECYSQFIEPDVRSIE